MNKASFLAGALLALVLLSSAAVAQRADRDQPVDIEADRVTVDDRNKVHIFEGSVVLTQGSLELRGERLVVTQGADGFQTGIATAPAGGLATFRQKREDSDEYIDGEAIRIEYDTRTEQAKLFERAKVMSGGDVVTGDYIEYDAITENYAATRLAPDGQGQRDTRVRVTIQPRE